MLFCLLCWQLTAYCQRRLLISEKPFTDSVARIAGAPATDITVEKPVNFFAAVGLVTRLQPLYDMTISPINNHIQFDDISRVATNVSTGVVWNPFQKKEIVERIYQRRDGTPETELVQERTGFAIAALSNIFQLSFSTVQANLPTQIDFGIGLGYRKDNFLALLTLEFPMIRQQRQYMIDGYKGKNLVATLPAIGTTAGNVITSFDQTNNAYFISRIIPSLGIKIAYAFSAPK